MARSPSSPRLIPVEIKYVNKTATPYLFFLSKSMPEKAPKNDVKAAGTPPHRKSGFIEHGSGENERQPLLNNGLTDSGCHGSSDEHDEDHERQKSGDNDRATAHHHQHVTFEISTSSSDTPGFFNDFKRPTAGYGASEKFSFMQGEKHGLLVSGAGEDVSHHGHAELYLSSVESIGHVSVATYCKGSCRMECFCLSS
jgi:hypothetical protein